jgi:transposase-like protein
MAHRTLPTCPHCDSANIERMPDRPYESQSPVTWFQCRDCKRLWSVPKPVPSIKSPDGQ